MRIRKLELQGFKSFADRTTFHFGSGVSGIVGPNGCGKSNVVDALKWCIGEQSARSLRGDAMSDVIFAGSSTRAAVGMAEVSLTLLAEEQPFPGVWARFGELEISRRLYREGGSEYLINQERVRLRDIQDLFLDTGVGNQMYSFIEQGRIGQIIHARPEARRQLIDEAAGITRFKARREETVERLAQAREAADRAEDRAQELHRAVKQAERQLLRAWRWRALQTRHRQAEIVHGLARYSVGEKRHQDLLARARVLQTELDEHSRAITRNDEQLGERRSKLEKLEEEAGKERELLANLETKRRTEESALRFREREQTTALERLERISKESEDLARERDHATIEAAGHATARQETEKLLHNAREALDRANLDIIQTSEALRQAREARDTAGRKSKEAYEAVARARAETTAQASRRQELQPRIARAQAAETAAREAEDRAITSVAPLQERLKAAEVAAQAALKENEVARAHVTTAENTLAQATREEKHADVLLTDATREREKVKARLDSLEDMQRRSPEVSDGLRAALNITGVMGLLGQKLELPESAEKLIGRALDGGLDYLLVPDATIALKVATSARGRVRLVIVPKEPPSPTGMALLAGGENSGKATLAQLLPQSESVATLKEALGQWSLGKTVVCQDGSLIRADGVIVLGGVEEGAGAAAIRRKRDILAIKEQLTAAETVLLAAKTAIQRSKERTREAETGLVSARQGSQRAFSEQRGRESAVLEVRQRIREQEAERVRQTKAREAAQAEANSLVQSQTRLEEEATRLASTLQAAESRHAEAEQALQSAAASIAANEPAYTTLAASVQKLRSDTNHLQKELSTWTSAEAAATERARSAARRTEAAVQERARLEERQRALVQETEVAALTLQGLVAQVAQAQQQVEGYKVQLQEMKESVRLGEAALKAARERHDQAATQHRRVENDLTAARAELEHLVADAESRQGYQLPILLERMLRNEQLLVAGFEPELVEGGPTGEKVPVLRVTPENLPTLAASLPLAKLQEQLAQSGGINVAAEEEYREAYREWSELESQRRDLREAADLIDQTLQKLDRTCRERFDEAFAEVNRRFGEYYPRLVGGGSARLELIGGDDQEKSLFTCGVDIYVQPPGKRVQSLALLSGGEKAMAALALVFALFSVRPSPFCILDEVDAPLDEANGARYNEMLKEMSATSQFIVVTHNKKTMEGADTLYGVTMPEPGISRLVAVRIE